MNRSLDANVAMLKAISNFLQLPATRQESALAVPRIQRLTKASKLIRAYPLTDSPDLAAQPCVRGIGVDSGMPDHQVFEAGYLSRRL
jgi:hypothetical protein